MNKPLSAAVAPDVAPAFRLAQSEGNHYHVVCGLNRVRGFDALKIDCGPQRGKFVLRGPNRAFAPMRKKELLQIVLSLAG